MLAPCGCSSSVWLASSAAAGVYALMYTGLPSLLLVTAVFLTHSATEASPGQRQSSLVAHDVLTMLVLTAGVPEVSMSGRLVVVVAGRGLAAIMSVLATAFTARIAHATARPRGRIARLLQRVRSGLGTNSAYLLLAAVVSAAFVHVFVALCLAICRLCVALAGVHTSAASAVEPPQPAAPAAAGEAALQDGAEDRDCELARAVQPGCASAGGRCHRGGAGVRARSAGTRRFDDAGAGLHQHAAPGVNQRCSCAATAGPAALAAVALAALLALPSCIACARAAWMTPVPEDALPGVAIACWILMLAAACDTPACCELSSSRPVAAVDSACCQVKRCAGVRIIASLACPYCNYRPQLWCSLSDNSIRLLIFCR